MSFDKWYIRRLRLIDEQREIERWSKWWESQFDPMEVIFGGKVYDDR